MAAESVSDWLKRIGLGAYAPAYADAGYDMWGVLDALNPVAGDADFDALVQTTGVRGHLCAFHRVCR